MPEYFIARGVTGARKLQIAPYAYVSERVVIGENVTIGPNAFIEAGVSIGDGAVIGAHALVLTDVPAGTTVKPGETWNKKAKVKPVVAEPSEQEPPETDTGTSAAPVTTDSTMTGLTTKALTGGTTA